MIPRHASGSGALFEVFFLNTTSTSVSGSSSLAGGLFFGLPFGVLFRLVLCNKSSFLLFLLFQFDDFGYGSHLYSDRKRFSETHSKE
jgi:hypothetical protein